MTVKLDIAFRLHSFRAVRLGVGGGGGVSRACRKHGNPGCIYMHTLLSIRLI